MKKNVLRLTTVMAALAVMLVMLCAFAKADVFATSYRFDLTPYEGQSAYAWFSTSYESDTLAYYEIKPSKTGIITFTADYSGYTVLCNSNWEPISYGYDSTGDYLNGNSSYAWMKTVSYGVKKGRTYYVGMSGYPSNRDSSNTYYATVKWSTSKIAAAKSGKKKSKAKSLKRKKTYKGLIVAGDKKAKWYKITTKKKTINLLFKAPKTNDTIQVTTYMRQYGHKGKWIKSTHTASRSGGYVKGPMTNYNGTKWTIYLKVQRKYKSSGYYTLKWK